MFNDLILAAIKEYLKIIAPGFVVFAILVIALVLAWNMPPDTTIGLGPGR